MPHLPELPRVEVDARRIEPPSAPFLRLAHHQLEVRVEGASAGRVVYSVVERDALDAAVIAAWFDEGGVRHVYLRACVRPPVSLRDATRSPAGWELPAGLVEHGEDPTSAAARELEEELGFAVEASAMRALGPAVSPAPAIVAEKLSFYHVRVSPDSRRSPQGDGSPLESVDAVIAVPLRVALQACAEGEILDAKTELGLRRLAEVS